MKFKKEIILIISVWVLFLIPFLILSGHFKNALKNMLVSSTLFSMDGAVSSLSSYAASILENNYNLNFDEKKNNLKDIISFLKSSQGRVIRGWAVYDKSFKMISSYNFDNKSQYIEILKSVKNSDMPSGSIEYPSDKPADLIIGRKVRDFYVLYKADLGYMISRLMPYVSKMDGVFYIIDGDYTVIYDSSYNYLIERNSVTSDIKKLIKDMVSQARFNYRGMIKIDNTDYLISIYNIENTKWWAFSVMSISEIDDPVISRWAERVVLTGIIIMLFMSILTLFIYRKFYAGCM